MTAKSKKQPDKLKECELFIQGMHCSACEVLIEKKLLKNKNIKAVDASSTTGKVKIEYQGENPSIVSLNSDFKEDNYTFSQKQVNFSKDSSNSFYKIDSKGNILFNKKKVVDFLYILGITFLLIIGFIVISKSGLSSLFSVTSSSTLPAFFLFGLLAGTSSCAALVGGIVLSMSKQWSEIYQEAGSLKQKESLKIFEPHIIFNAGRLISFFVLGSILGMIGGVLQISLTFTSILTIGVSVMMLILAFQMLGFKSFQRFQFRAPKFLSRYIADEQNFQGRYMPGLMGALTFFLPCGFTITAQGLALASGTSLQGGLIMLSFALGTLPMLLVIALSSAKFTMKPHLSNRFLKIAGILVLFFALYNFNAQMNVLGLPSLNDFMYVSSVADIGFESGLPPIIDGKQILKMDAIAYSYQPNYLKVREDIPVQWEITDKGTSGCTNAVISKSLFDGEINLTPGQTSIKEFTPQKTGKYKFSCWMGMVSGIIEVVGKDGTSTIEVIDSGAEDIAPSGETRCGCGSKGCGDV